MNFIVWQENYYSWNNHGHAPMSDEIRVRKPWISGKVYYFSEGVYILFEFYYLKFDKTEHYITDDQCNDMSSHITRI